MSSVLARSLPQANDTSFIAVLIGYSTGEDEEAPSRSGQFRYLKMDFYGIVTDNNLIGSCEGKVVLPARNELPLVYFPACSPLPVGEASRPVGLVEHRTGSNGCF